jgi:hypothetical protein
MTKSVTTKIKKCIEIAKCLKKDRQTGRAFHVTFVYNKNKLISIGINNLKKLHRRNMFGAYKGFKDNPEKYIPCDVPSQKDAKTRSQSLDIAINVDGSSSMFGYVNQLRSFTQGRANYSMFFNHYDEVPSNVAAEIKEKLA